MRVPYFGQERLKELIDEVPYGWENDANPPMALKSGRDGCDQSLVPKVWEELE